MLTNNTWQHSVLTVLLLESAVDRPVSVPWGEEATHSTMYTLLGSNEDILTMDTFPVDQDDMLDTNTLSMDVGAE